MVEDMSRAMAWNIAGAGRRTRDAAAQAARRAGMGLDDWLDEAIAQYAALDEPAQVERNGAQEGRLDAAAERLERLAQRTAHTPHSPGIPDSFNSAVERFETRLSRAEAQAARAFETVAQILERDSAARDSDRRALIDAVRRLESIRASLTGGALTGETRRERFPQQLAPDLKPPHDLKAAVSQVAMRRHEIEARSAGGGTDVTSSDAQTADAAPAPAPGGATRDPSQLEASEGAAEDGSGDPPRAAGATPPLTQLLLDDIRALALKVDDLRRERAEPSGGAVDLGAMRAEIDAMRQSLADLAPRNAVVAVEGAIRDLVQRVDMARQNGQGGSMLAPLEAMAAEFRAALKAHDPQAAAAGLEREIRALGGRIDSLAAAAINPETFERIRQQTEEVRNLLASAALRTAPLERLERQIGELADRVERLGSSPAPHFESAEMAAMLAEACRQIERSTSPAALASIERRLEGIATRLDQEIARPSVPAPIDPGPFEELARQIDGVRQSLESRPPATIDAGPIERLLRDFDAKLGAAGRADADMEALRSIVVKISDKLDRLTDSEVGASRLEPVLQELGARLDAVASPVDLNPIETLLRSLDAKLDAAASVDPEVVEKVASEVARRLRDLNPRQVDLQAVARQIDTIYDRINTLTANGAPAADPQPVMQQLLERLREADRAESSPASETSAAINAALGMHLAELRAERTSADQRTQSRLADLQSILEALGARLASIENELAGEGVDEELRPPTRSASPAPAVGSALPSSEALGPEVSPQRPVRPRAAMTAEDPSLQTTKGEDFLIEPGAGAPQRAREARELAQMIGPKTNPAVTVHIAAARRAALAALAETSAEPMSGATKASNGSERAPFAARGVQTARALYANHRRTVLLGVAIAIAATLAVRMVGVRAPFLQGSELGGQAFKTAKIDPTKAKPAGAASAAKSGGETIDVAPTASIAQPPSKPSVPDLAPSAGPSASDLMATIPPGISSSLRDGVAAGQPAAQYELAMRLFEGRGLPKDLSAAVHWFERAASAGLAPAQYRLGSMYEKGVGAPRDPAAAKRWYLKAATAGNARAAHNLAVMSADPDGGEANYLEAAKWFRKAAELGVRDSQYNLAILYARGLGVDKDLGQAFLWFALAAQQGDADAAKKRDEIAGQMDTAALASAVEALMKFKAVKPDPGANEVAPLGG
jgi:localization factor PodJL